MKKTNILAIVLFVLISTLTLSILIQAAQSQDITTLTKRIQAAWIAQDGTLYAGTTNSIYKSSDHGQTWSASLKTVPNSVDTSCVFVGNNGYIYYSAAGNGISRSNSGLWRSINQGQTWTRVLALNAGQCIWGIDTDANGNLFAGVYTTGSLNANARIYRSTNNGASWTSVYYDSTARHVHDVAVNKASGYIYASVGDSLAPWNIHYVIRSTNGGASWSKILTNMPQVVGIEATPTARLFGSDSTYGAIYRTTNDNSYTETLNTGASSYCFWIKSNDIANEIYAGFCGGEWSPRNSGIYVSGDNGQSWELMQSFQTQRGYDGTTAASNFVQGILYHDVVLNGMVQNGECITTTPQPTSTPTVTPSPTPTPTASPTSTPTPTATPTPTPAPVGTAVKVSANVTVTAAKFSQSNAQLNVTLIKNDINYVQAVISKTSLPDIAPLKVYINNIQTAYSYVDDGTSWKVTVLTS